MTCKCADAHEENAVASSLERLRYFPRQLLTADDMRVEQEYFREKQRRHNRFLHGWGVVCGLEVVPDPANGAMAVKICPGYALGPWGDEIFVEDSTPFDLSYCTRPASEKCRPAGVVAVPAGPPQTLLIKIRYVECASRPMRTLPAGCGCDETACEYSRTRDGFEIQCFVKPDPGGKPATAPARPAVDPEVPACLPDATDSWVLLAEAERGANGLTVKNDVRRVVPNTPSLAG
jgi:hypothetical protein